MHLTSIGIENIRVFRERQKIKLAPLTILTGPNNSGKSTFTKTLLLLKDTFSQYSSRKRFEPRITAQKLDFDYFARHLLPHHLVFDGRSNHALGSFASILSHESDNRKLVIQLPFVFPEIIEDNEGQAEFTYRHNSRDNELESVRIILQDTIIYKANFQYDGNKLSGQNTEFNLNALEDLFRRGQFHLRNEEPLDFTVGSLYEFSTYYGLAHELTFSSCLEDFGKYYYPFVGEEKNLPDRYFDLLKLSDDQPKPEYIEELHRLEKSFINRTSKNGFLKFETQQDSFLALGAESLISQFNKSFSNHLFEHFSRRESLDHVYVGKYDESYDRYAEKFGEPEWYNYNPSWKTIMLFGIIDRSISFNLEVYSNIFKKCNLLSISDVGFDDLVTRKNERLFNLLNSLNEIQVFDQKQKESHHKYRVQSFIKESLRKLKMGDEISVRNVQDYGFEIQLDTGRGLIPLKNQGFGIRKLISLILSISSQAHSNQFELSSQVLGKDDKVVFHPNLIILEEPEANLHPAYQSILADILLLAGKWFNMQFIVETHSEYLVRKYQYLTARESDVKQGNIAIHYFHENADKEAPKLIEIEEDGSLTDDFGSGFFDEAIKTKFDLMRLKNPGHD